MAVAAEAFCHPHVTVLARKGLDRLVQRVPEVAAKAPGVRRCLGDHAVDDSVGGQVNGPDALARGQFGGAAYVAVNDGAGAFGGQWCEPGVLGSQDAIGRQQGQGRAAGSLPEQERDGRDRDCNEIGQAPGDLAGQAVHLGLSRHFGARRIDYADQRQAEPGGQPDAPSGYAQGTRPEGRALVLPGDQHARVAADAGQGEDQSRRRVQ